MVKLSVIIPCYNVSPKIAKCFASIDQLHAALPEVEAIFIDDCSPDDTFTKIEAFAATRDWVCLLYTSDAADE